MEQIRFTEQEAGELLRMPFAECVASVLNRLFDTEVPASYLDFFIGRYPVRLTALTQRVMIGECWHSVSGSFSESVSELAKHLGAENADVEAGWRNIGITAAVICGMLGQIFASGQADWERGVNFAAVTGDFSLLMSAWYVRSWGFPLRNIICCCGENDGIWELLHSGAFHTDSGVPTELERLIFHVCGDAEAERFSDCCRLGKTYYIDEEQQHRLSRELAVCVVGENRALTTIGGIYGSNSYILPPAAATAYAGAMDYRIAAADHGTLLVPALTSPICDCEIVANALHISQETFSEYWKNR